jgi:hypothetical protein
VFMGQTKIYKPCEEDYISSGFRLLGRKYG